MSKKQIILRDHLGGFDKHLNNSILAETNNSVDSDTDVYTCYLPTAELQKKYPNISFKVDEHLVMLTQQFKNYKQHPEINFKNFVCSFNGSVHVGRKLLVAGLQKYGYFDPEFCSKNFTYTNDILYGHLTDLVSDPSYYYTILSNSEEFNNTIYSFSDYLKQEHIRYDHKNNIYNLEEKITSSFVHIVSDTLPTSYYPLFCEKPFYSIVTRGLFIAYSQPNWHRHFSDKLGFKKYDKIFKYDFDDIKNPVDRLISLLSMLSVYKNLSSDDWRDLYHMEQDNIEYNYDHYFSGDYVKCMRQYQ